MVNKLGIIILMCLISSGQYFGEEKQVNYIPILTYHHVQKQGTFDEAKFGSGIVTPEQLANQLIYLKMVGYNTITSQDLENYYKSKSPLPPNPILITFDDGYLSNYEYVFPLLKKLNMKATIFVVVKMIRDDMKPNSGHPAFFSWQQAKEMVDSGLVDIQSHTYDLHKKIDVDGNKCNAMTHKISIAGTLETDEQYKYRIKSDISRSKQLIETYLNNKVVALSFPYGDFNQVCQDICHQLEINLLFTTKEGVNGLFDKPQLLKRININQKHSGQDIIRLIQKNTKEIN